MLKKIVTCKIAVALIGVLLVVAHSVRAAEGTSKSTKASQTATNASGTASHTHKINLNTATVAELETLPHVGPSTANAIIAARPFKSIEDLKQVNGISDARFTELKGKVMVSSAHSSASGGHPSSATDNVGAAPGKTKSSANSSATSSANQTKAKPGSGKVNINTASLEELDTLPGIGPVKAQAIIDARPFTTPEDIMKVSGIKEGEYGKIRDLIKVK